MRVRERAWGLVGWDGCVCLGPRAPPLSFFLTLTRDARPATAVAVASSGKSATQKGVATGSAGSARRRRRGAWGEGGSGARSASPSSVAGSPPPLACSSSASSSSCPCTTPAMQAALWRSRWRKPRKRCLNWRRVRMLSRLVFFFFFFGGRWRPGRVSCERELPSGRASTPSKARGDRAPCQHTRPAPTPPSAPRTHHTPHTKMAATSAPPHPPADDRADRAFAAWFGALPADPALVRFFDRKVREFAERRGWWGGALLHLLGDGRRGEGVLSLGCEVEGVRLPRPASGNARGGGDERRACVFFFPLARLKISIPPPSTPLSLSASGLHHRPRRRRPLHRPRILRHRLRHQAGRRPGVRGPVPGHV